MVVVSIEHDNIEHTGNAWRARIRPGILPGRIAVRIDSPGYRPAKAEITTLLDEHDSGGDGTPDFMRLDDPEDQTAFRDWFVWLAEAQYFLPPAVRRREVDDCAALIRFAYREALRKHNNDWIDSIGLPEYPAFDSVEKYSIPGHAARRRAVPRTARALPGRRSARRSFSSVCRCTDALAFQRPPGEPRCVARAARRPAVFPAAIESGDISRNDLRGREQGTARWASLSSLSHRASGLRSRRDPPANGRGADALPAAGVETNCGEPLVSRRSAMEHPLVVWKCC